MIWRLLGGNICHKLFHWLIGKKRKKNEEWQRRGKFLFVDAVSKPVNAFKTTGSRLVLCNVAEIGLVIALLNYVCDKSSLFIQTSWYPNEVTKHQEAGKRVNTLFSWRHIEVDDWLCEAASESEPLKMDKLENYLISGCCLSSYSPI